MSKLTFQIMIMLTTVICATAGTTAFAMTPATSTDRVERQRNSDQATGLFGGIRKDGTFVFLYSESKGVRFYRTVPGIRAVGNGTAYDLAVLPTRTPIKIRTQDGKITSVELQGVVR